MPQPPAALLARQACAVVAFVALACGAACARAADYARAVVPAPAVGENHGAAVAALPSGGWLVCWYSGAHEEDRSVRILCSRGSPDGVRWSEPWTAVAPGDQAAGARAPNKSLGNVTLTVAPDGRVWMIHGVIQSRRWPLVGEVCRNWACGRIDARVSADDGRTWSAANRLVDAGGALPRAKLARSQAGWLGPFYLETKQQSFIADIELTGPKATVSRLTPLAGWKLIQPALAPASGGGFRAFFRDQQRRGVYTAHYDPAAHAWSGVTRTNLPNPGSAVDVFTDDAGRYVLIYNPSSASRDKLALARSTDGAYFTPGCDLSSPASEPVAAYPSVSRDRDGAWGVVYSANAKGRVIFVRFTNSWLEECFSGKG
jgi:hypothetical protein